MTYTLLTILIWLSLGALSYVLCINKKYLEGVLPEISEELKREEPRLSDNLIRELVFSKLFLIMWVLFFPILLPISLIYTLYKYIKGDYNETNR